MPERPKEMLTGDRQPVQQFDANERFYCRVHPEHVQPDGTIIPLHIQCPNLSSNRSKFSEPWYVLFPLESFSTFAVFGFNSDGVPRSVQADDPNAVIYAVRNVHCPEPDNYAHCEIRLYREAEQMSPHKINKTAKKKFRTQMSLVMCLVRNAGEPLPNTATNPPTHI